VVVVRDVELAGRLASVRIVDGVVDAIAPRESASAAISSDVVIDGQGGALLAGLHDHHVHVHALAAAMESVTVGPPAVTDPAAFTRVLRDAARAGRPVRAVGYHERVAGELDRAVLDAIVGDVAVRVQHRSGGLWVLNTAALREAGLVDDPVVPSGAQKMAPDGTTRDARVELDVEGRPTGRLWRADELLRDGRGPGVELARVGSALASVGVTALTDSTATNDASSVARLAALPQHVRVMGPLDLDLGDQPVSLGEVKVLLDDDRLPDFDDTVALVGAAHAQGRGVAVHCVTLVQLQFAIAVLRAAGVQRDRIEHASVAPPDAIAAMRVLGLTVAVQPGFVAERGDDYLRDVDARDIGALYPIASLIRAGVTALGSTDAPYTAFDPWSAMRAAVDRRTPSHAIVGEHERIAPEAALALFGADRPITPGACADLVLLRVPLASALERLDASDVAVTMIAGDVIHDAR
jgi:predicted amidohydrolase YtcJ